MRSYGHLLNNARIIGEDVINAEEVRISYFHFDDVSTRVWLVWLIKEIFYKFYKSVNSRALSPFPNGLS